ncbi:MAG: hypothetical protein H7A25_22095 [Leptospiraceae bacterium]|nr:hypothetical protein [Leptospiraceae bacterium]
MELFNRDDYLTDKAKEEEIYKKVRRRFSKTNKEMTDTLDRKVKDSENINYSSVHLEVYKGVGLGETWRVDKSQSPDDINIASNGFKEVKNEFQEYKDKSVFSKSIIHMIISIFKK